MHGGRNTILSSPNQENKLLFTCFSNGYIRSEKWFSYDSSSSDMVAITSKVVFIEIKGICPIHPLISHHLVWNKNTLQWFIPSALSKKQQLWRRCWVSMKLHV